MEIEYMIEEFTCRCCLNLSEEDTMDNIFECFYENIGFQELLSIIAPVNLLPNDGKFHKKFSN